MSSTDLNVIYFKYSVSRSSGELIDTSSGKMVSILQGANQIFKVIESAMLRSAINQKCKLEVAPCDAFGEYDESLVYQVPESKFGTPPAPGSKYKVKVKSGVILEMSVVDQKENFCILDGNHPLAGVNLVFEYEVIRRRPAQQFEIQSGRVRPDF